MTTRPPTRPLAEVLFPDLDLGDARRERRFADLIDTPRGGHRLVPPRLPDAADYDACLRLFDAPQATHANLLAAHQVAVLDRLEAVATPVLLHDATQLDCSGHTTLAADTGPIGNGGGRG
ncbi:MAG TPA: hypothetical protein VM597_24775 [Gemmataceae bacterium]|nr:hypothetical protein [Gemmataceae bacterium]